MAVAEREEEKDVQDQVVMFHRVHKSASSAVRRDHWARECSRMDDGPWRNRGAYSYGAWTCWNPASCLNSTCDAQYVNLACGAAVDAPQEEDEVGTHAAFLVEAKGFGVLDCGATILLGGVERAEALFSNVQGKYLTRIPDNDLSDGRSFNFGDGVSSNAISFSRLPVQNHALDDFWVRVRRF